MVSDEYFKDQKKRLEESKWLEDILSKDGCCLICGYNENPLILEKHHIAGKHNSDLTITVCPNCHRELSKKQESWNKDWNKKNNPVNKRFAFILRGICDLFRVKSDYIKIISNKILNGE